MFHLKKLLKPTLTEYVEYEVYKVKTTIFKYFTNSIYF